MNVGDIHRFIVNNINDINKINVINEINVISVIKRGCVYQVSNP